MNYTKLNNTKLICKKLSLQSDRFDRYHCNWFKSVPPQTFICKIALIAFGLSRQSTDEACDFMFSVVNCRETLYDAKGMLCEDSNNSLAKPFILW